MFCQSCGAEMPNGSTFCTKCGNKLDQSPEASAAPTAPMPTVAATPAPLPVNESASSAGAATTSASEATPVDYKAAKAAYKQARKDAGKSRKPLIIGIAIAVVVLVGAGAAGMWALMGAFGDGSEPGEAVAPEQVENTEAAAEDAEAPVAEDADAGAASAEEGPSSKAESASAAAVSSASGAAVADGGIEKWTGTWSGNLTSTDSFYPYYRCYGAEDVPMVLNIAAITEAGKVTADATFLFHGHSFDELQGDVESVTGDEVIELTNLVGTFDERGFSMHGEAPDKSAVTLKVTPLESSETVLSVSVSGEYATDTYELRKQ